MAYLFGFLFFAADQNSRDDPIREMHQFLGDNERDENVTVDSNESRDLLGKHGGFDWPILASEKGPTPIRRRNG